MNAIKNITIGHTERLYKPVGFTMLANLVNIVPFCLSIERYASFSMLSTEADSRSTPPVCGGYSASWPFICWSWLWRKGQLIAPISGELTR